MSENYTEKVGRQTAKTTLTTGEKAALFKMQGVMKTEGEADTIRQILRERMKLAGFLG